MPTHLLLAPSLVDRTRQLLNQDPDRLLHVIGVEVRGQQKDVNASSSSYRVIQLIASTPSSTAADIFAHLPSGILLLGVLCLPSTRDAALTAVRNTSSDMPQRFVVTHSDTSGIKVVRLKEDGKEEEVEVEISDSTNELLPCHVHLSTTLYSLTRDGFTTQLEQLSNQIDSLIYACGERLFLDSGAAEDDDEDDESDETLASLLADDHPFLSRKRQLAKAASSNSSSSSSASSASSALAISTNSICSLPLSSSSLSFTLLHRSTPASSNDGLHATPTMHFTGGNVYSLPVCLSVLHFADATAPASQVMRQMKQAVKEQLKRGVKMLQKDTTSNLMLSSTATPISLRALHYQPSAASACLPLTALYLAPLPSTLSSPAERFTGNTSGMFPAIQNPDDIDAVHPNLIPTPFEQATLEQRKRLHEIFSIPQQPTFRLSNAISFPSLPLSSDPHQYIIQPRLLNVHINIPRLLESQTGKGGAISVVRGDYAYYHYLQDGLNDSGWACAYRTLQSICSWYILQSYTHQRPVPTIADIQEILVGVGDKPSKFKGSTEWIGSTEVGLVLQHCYGMITKTLFVSSGGEVSSISRQLRDHFNSVGTPVMIGGGVLAYGLLGIDYNESSGETRYLILDPHYTGKEDIATILKGGWVAWKKADLFLSEHFYNFALPQRPNDTI